ncbi:hypothetical protein [Rhizobium sp. UBA1881]|jgi:hypothetical protein|uniref:hypothetical protein n=1 Tax=Rhizobium sp. UBA1881 TaxID=1947375 RepID=UPI0025E6C5C9|nr:hypothetical protein [Rhizobium sp. UBA1881]
MAYHIGRLWGIGKHLHPFEASSDDNYNQFVEDCLSVVVKETLRSMTRYFGIPLLAKRLHRRIVSEH